MAELLPIPGFNLKVIFLIHFVFISISSMGAWATSAYIFYNLTFIFLLIWSIHHSQSHEPIQLAIVVNGCSIILEILLLILCFPDIPSVSENIRARERFSVAMAILHLIFRPFSEIFLIKNLEERSGSTGVLTGILSQGRNESYEDMDRPNVPQSSSNTGGYDFSSAQQI